MTADHDPGLVTGSFDIASGPDQERVRQLADSMLASALSADFDASGRS